MLGAEDFVLNNSEFKILCHFFWKITLITLGKIDCIF